MISTPAESTRVVTLLICNTPIVVAREIKKHNVFLFTLVGNIFAHTGIANGKSHKGFARLQHWRTSFNTIGRRFKLMHKPQRLL
jgi:hypothetical protein